MRTATLLALAAILPLAACDTYYDDDDDTFVRVIDFELDVDGYDVSGDGLTASYDLDDIQSRADQDDVADALRLAGDGALVLLYADNQLILDVETTGQTYTALPVTKGFEAVDEDGLPFVDYTVTFTYAFDNQDLYIDVLSSAELDFDVLFGDVLGVGNEIEFRLVTLEADVVFSKQSEVAKTGRALDFRNYEEVKTVFGLPD
ncbi:MAG: hypothetical protein AAF791_01385 [Bacteroidota bacterium]